MRISRLLGLSRVWDYLFDTWNARFRKLGLGRRSNSQGIPRTFLQFASLEDRVVPARPIPLPLIFAGVGSGLPAEVKAYKAETGELLYTRTPFGDSFTGGVRVAAGDIDRDGIPDLIAAAGVGGGPRVVVYSGMTGKVLRDFFAYDAGFSGGVYVASGDVNGDGSADIITAAGAGGGPHVKVFSGQDNSLMASFFAFAPEFSGGATVAAADFSGDGKADLVVGAGPGGGPHVKVFDISTGEPVPQPMGSFFAFDTKFTGGVDVGTDALAGDVTGDGQPDIVVGRGAGAGSLVRVFDGKTAEMVREFSPFGDSMTAGVRVATAYVDDDAYADVVVGSGKGATSTIKVFNGLTSQELASPMSPYQPFGADNAGGLFVAASNDPVTASLGNNSGGGYKYDATYTMFAEIYDPNSTSAPTGTITFNRSGSGATLLGTGTLVPITGTTTSKATITLAVNQVMPGTYGITGVYSGDSNFIPYTYTLSGPLSVYGPSAQPNPSMEGQICLPCPPLLQAPSGTNNSGPGGTDSNIRNDGAVSRKLFSGLSGAPAWVPSQFNGSISWSNAAYGSDGLSGDGSMLSPP